MNTEDFCTYEQALALKKLGFDKYCDYIFTSQGKICPKVILSYDYREREGYVDSPTLAQAHKWIITKGLLVVPYSMSFESWQCRICKKGESFLSSKLYEDFYSYEEALSEGITECIKLLKKNEEA